MGPEMRFGRGMSSSSKRKGAVLLELVIAGMLILLMAGIAAPAWTGWQEERKLEAAAAEMSAIIRDVEMGVRNGDARFSTSTSEDMRLVFMMRNGRVYYYAARGSQQVKPVGYLAEGVRLEGTKAEFIFKKDGTPSGKMDYTVNLITTNRKYRRTLVVAVYTGRVRIEKGS